MNAIAIRYAESLFDLAKEMNQIEAYSKDIDLIRNVLIRGVFDEDLYQELAIETLKCIQRFKQLE